MCKSSYVQVITQQCGEKQLEQHLAVCILKLVRGCWQRLLHPDFGSALATEHDLWCLRTLLLQGKCNIPPSHHPLLIWARLKAVLKSRQLEGGGGGRERSTMRICCKAARSCRSWALPASTRSSSASLASATLLAVALHPHHTTHINAAQSLPAYRFQTKGNLP